MAFTRILIPIYSSLGFSLECYKYLHDGPCKMDPQRNLSFYFFNFFPLFSKNLM